MSATHASAQTKKSSRALQRMDKKPAETTQTKTTTSNDRLSAFYTAGPPGHLIRPVQLKVVVGKPDDRYEREADGVADSVASGQQVSSVSRIPAGGLSGSAQRQEENDQNTEIQKQDKKENDPIQEKRIQRESDEKEDPVQAESLNESEENHASAPEQSIQRKEQTEEHPVQRWNIQRRMDDTEEETAREPAVQRTSEIEKEPLQTLPVQRVMNEEDSVRESGMQRKAEAEENQDEPVQNRSLDSQPSSESKSMQNTAEHAIHSKGAGKPMIPETRSTLEAGLGVDLGDVRIHDDDHSRHDAADLRARAFTHKNHIWLGPGESQENVRLMAHETAHVLQQEGIVRRKPNQISRVSPRIQRGIGKFFSDTKEWALQKVSNFANEKPWFKLLSVILGKNPITEKPVARNAVNLVKGVLSLTKGGEKLYNNLQESGALEQAFEWFSNQIEKLDITWTVIKGLFEKGWDSLSVFDSRNPSKAFAKVEKIFMAPIIRVKNFAAAVGKKVMQFVFEGALRLAGPAGKKVMNVIQKGKETFWLIVSNPIGFLGNLLKAVALGFNQFSGNIWKHLRKGLMGWLFGTLSKAGITMPEKFDMKGIVSLVLQILRLTYTDIRVKLVKLLGEPTVKYLETAFEFLKILVTEGLAGAWKKIVEYMGSLKEMIIGAIRNWVVTKIVKSAITKLATMFNPVGAIIQAVITIYNTIMFFIERAKQIMALANAVFDSIINIAKGKLKAAADYVELTMARTIPVIISFLARLLNLGGIAGKIKEIIKKIQLKVSKALDKVIAFIVKQAKKLFGKGKTVVKKGVEKVKNLFFPKKKITIGKESHSIEATKTGKNYDILIRSKEMTVEGFIKYATQQGGLKRGLDKEINRLAIKYKDWKMLPVSNQEQTENKGEKYQKILKNIEKIWIKLPNKDNIPVSNIVWGAMDEGRATSVKADPLTIKGAGGGKPTDNNIPGWASYTKTKLKPLRKISSIRAHLLHHELHGPGKRFNLTPASNRLNRALMYNKAEKPVLEALGLRGKKDKKNESTVSQVIYETTVKYEKEQPYPLNFIAKRIEVSAKNKLTGEQALNINFGEDNYSSGEASIIKDELLKIKGEKK